MKCIDLTGQIFGDLTVLNRAENTKEGRAQWNCICKCGNQRIALGKLLRNGVITSCSKCSRKLSNYRDLKNKCFGNLTCLEPTDRRAGTSVIWKCLCSCGNICYKDSHSLTQGKTKSCGCLQQASRKIVKKNLINKKFGKLSVIELTNESNREGRLWKCKCECGRERLASGYALEKGRVQSCGCLNSLGNRKIEEILSNLHIKFYSEYKFTGCKDIKPLFFDFFLPDYNLYIEYDGQQHDEIVKYWGGQEGLKNRQKKDEIKNKFCIENNIHLIRISQKDYDLLNEQYFLDLLSNLKR